MQYLYQLIAIFKKLRVSKYKVISDISDTRKELNKPIYEANKPIYGSDDDVDADDYDEEEDYDYVDYDDVDLPDLSDDDDYDMNQTDDSLDASIRNYVEEKISQGENPTLNQITALRVCKKNNLTCKDLLSILNRLGFAVEDNDNIPMYKLRVVA